MNKLHSLIYPEAGNRKNIFFSGKGGVGKTSMACITAVKTASEGYKTLLITTDPAAHIGNVLDRPVTEAIVKVVGISNLYAVKIDAKMAFQNYRNSILEDAKTKFNEDTIRVMEEELNSPCTEEMAAFLRFIELASDESFQVIIFDTAPTGHTLRLLELPMNWSKQIEMKAGVNSKINPEDEKQKDRFDRVVEMMRDKKRTTFAFVMYPEKTPIIEAYRASEELESLGIITQLAVVNLIIPEEQAKTAFFKNRRNMQLKYIEDIKEKFKEAELLKVPMFEKEIKGLDLLSDITKIIL